ncbi:MAG: hypothetical protein II567_01470 [Candidatus Riflebacteria bacterium]|nr:hypothetical protein [Candidatus Riflebacteria bacterium]
MRFKNKGFTVVELVITIMIFCMISIPLYFVLSDSSNQANIIAARNHIKQEGNKVFKILENDLTQAKLGSFSQKNNEFSIKVRTRVSEKETDNLLLAKKENHDGELKYTLEKPKLYRTITEDGKTKKWLVSKTVDSIVIDEPSAIEAKNSPGKLAVKLVMKSDLAGIKEKDQPTYEQSKIIVMMEDAASVKDPNWLDVGTIGGVFQTDGNLLADLKEQFIALGNGALSTILGTLDDIVGMTAGQLKEKLSALSLDELKDAIGDLKNSLKEVGDQMTDVNSQLKELEGGLLYGVATYKDYWWPLTKSGRQKKADKENERRNQRAKEVGELVAGYKEQGQMSWEAVKSKAGGMTNDGTESLKNLFDSKKALFESESKVKEALDLANEQLGNLK